MKLSIITITYNNTEGLRRTIESVQSQTYRDFEHIIVDGGSTDGSVDVIREYESSLASRLSPLASNLKWISEKDTGIYNAMNKGIAMAKGEYLQFLNSGDWLAGRDTLSMLVSSASLDADIVYGNSIKTWPDGTQKKADYSCYVTGKVLFNHTIPHQASFIRSSLFHTIGLYSEDLRFGSDWEFYLKALFYHNCSFKYVDIDICLFDMTGISTDESLTKKMLDERELVLQRLIPQLYADYKEMNENIRRIKMIDTRALRVGKIILKPYRMLKKIFTKK